MEKTLEKHYKSHIIKSRDGNTSRSAISYISVLQNQLKSLLSTEIPELQRAWFFSVWVMPRNLHFIKIPRLFCCWGSLNHSLGSSRLKICENGETYKGRGDQERFDWSLEGWAEFGEEVVGGDSEKGYWRWGWEWDMLQRLSSYSPVLVSFLPRHIDYISQPSRSGAWPFNWVVANGMWTEVVSLLVLAHKILPCDLVFFHGFSSSIHGLDVDALDDLGINVVKLAETPPVCVSE